ncbi:hypothetical protein L226DRAFT_58826 [Lentinus tigrinus ALCF2SS1-7]|uniref:uncharacterized protein n=1 Tax=Lentinus tigrinus ALCF2SS1-7 TaxID=1328758 RepID=UPI001166328B|nr:hypothetical protein L226DRAFT_58826 [Lentinus tigrinus ALCF2SS1-7]
MPRIQISIHHHLASVAGTSPHIPCPARLDSSRNNASFESPPAHPAAPQQLLPPAEQRTRTQSRRTRREQPILQESFQKAPQQQACIFPTSSAIGLPPTRACMHRHFSPTLCSSSSTRCALDYGVVLRDFRRVQNPSRPLCTSRRQGEPRGA